MGKRRHRIRLGTRAGVLALIVVGAVLAVVALTSAADMTGTKGNDRLQGGDQADNIKGLAGNDAIFGGGGDDVIAGGAASDTVAGGDGNDELHGGACASR